MTSLTDHAVREDDGAVEAAQQAMRSNRSLFNQGWSFRTKVTAFAELGGSRGAEWTEVHLPHDALIGQTRRADAPRGETNGFFPGGAFEYRRTYSAPEQDAGSLVLLEFDGVYRDAAVFVNGNLAGTHAYGYSRFTVRIDPFLRFGDDNEIRVECRTSLDSRWYAGAGIYRDVHLIVKRPGRIVHDGIRITTPDATGAEALVEVEALVENAGPLTRTYRLEVALRDDAGVPVGNSGSPITLLPGTTGTVHRRLHLADPALWSVDAPHLHHARIVLHDGDEIVDTEHVTFGIRSLQLDPTHGLRINGEPVKLRGACIHLDNGPLGVVSMLPAEERKVTILKEAGFNAVRSSHAPMSTALLDACDRLGMLVMDETFDMWTQAKSDNDYAFDFAEWWERDVEAMVAKDRHHPSVIFYSIGNEIPETGTAIGSIWGRRLAEKVRSLDPTRYVTNGVNPFVAMIDTIVPQMKAQRSAAAEQPGGGVNTMMAGFGAMMGRIQASEQATQRTEESFAVLDVAGMNYADARYELDRELFPDRIIVGSETWPSSIVGNWALVKADSRVIGDFTWTGWDYLGEVGIGVNRYVEPDAEAVTGFSGAFPALTAGCGDIDITGIRLPVSYFREIVFGRRSEPYIAVGRPERHGQELAVQTPWAWTDSLGSWSWPGFEGRPIRVEVYSDAEQVELVLNGSSLGIATVGAELPFRAIFETEYAPGELVAVAMARGLESGRSVLHSAGTDISLSVEVDRSTLRSDGSDLAHIAVAFVDESGVVHNTTQRSMTVDVSGPAVLQALGTGATSTAEPFTANRCTTYDGRALAVVRPIASGSITVTITGEGCEPVVVTFTT
ncbi:glycoside hydrolase family 2 TIM barrel-domain containing protein [Microbacterium sp. KSW2-21]|uniref:Glycoside hydrolase family 2 TIM barrel-domain containing protein n=1 Tax=Microbacterium algihabitans TaxID=3075992 RepID=A0ABU3S055_9MICO|nr:glycoside hydrolase family 2 TIM barrel-domain containing protein [Microbacterium sp. KSW2-21]MDU0328444.1 glycoside hydrolase family 2 TIM barrel-domain containing protein [Microbacterium sp. KSW2-21]